jgi:hypothetical protein
MIGEEINLSAHRNETLSSRKETYRDEYDNNEVKEQIEISYQEEKLI